MKALRRGARDTLRASVRRKQAAILQATAGTVAGRGPREAKRNYADVDTREEDAPALEARLRLGTADLHRAAERTTLMRALLRGELARTHYLSLLVNLLALYEALEAGLRRHADAAAVGPVCFPALFRARALRADIARMGHDGSAPVRPCEAARAYVIRLQSLDVRPALLAAHAYVRYLGDLSGGQVLKRVLARAAATQAGSALAFYEFGEAEAVAGHTRAFRRGLGMLPADPASVQALVEEARWAFSQHVAMFDEIVSCS
jgi:heme oxygenase